MSLTAAEVAEIVRLLEESSFDELHLEMGSVKLSLKRGQGGVRPSEAVPPASQARIRSESGSSAAGGANGFAGSAKGVTPGRESAAAPARVAPATTLPDAGEHAGALAGALAGAEALSAADVEEVKSPLLGTFYRAPKPGSAPFVDVGSVVEEDTVVAIIEVMKLMNTVRAGVRGTVTDILVSDGALVEYGETLLRVRLKVDEAS